MKVIPKQRECEAIQWTKDNWREVLRFMRQPIEENRGEPSFLLDDGGEDFTIGDWVIRFDDDSIHSIPDDGFRANWEICS